jgi:ABC-2 type transport system permease protein
MKTLWILLKNNFLNTFKINKLLKQKKSKIFLYSFLAIFITLYLLGTVTFYAYMASNFLEKNNMLPFLLVLFFALASITTFMLNLYSAKGGLFNTNDNDMLFSMPIKSSTILMSRLLNLIISNLLLIIFFTLPAVIIYDIKAIVPSTYYLLVFVTMILLPVIPTILSCVVGYIIARLTAKSNKKNWFEIIISFIFILIIMVGSGYTPTLLNYIVNDMEMVLKILKYGFYPIYLISKIFLEYDLLSILLFIIINIGVFILFTFILNRNYKTIILKLSEHKTTSNYNMTSLKAESINKALFKKDLKRYFSSPIYVFNTAFGQVLILLMAILSFFYSQEKIYELLEIDPTQGTPFMILSAIVTFIIFMTDTTSASISIEGKNFWILKSLPIEPKKVLNSKIFLNLFIALPISLISIIILKFTFMTSYIQMLVLMILAILSSFMIAQFGLLINLKFPKMDAISDVVAVKQSLSVLISVLLPLIIMFSVIGIYGAFGSSINFNVFISIVLGVFAIINMIEHTLLNTWGIKRFKEIN